MDDRFENSKTSGLNFFFVYVIIFKWMNSNHECKNNGNHVVISKMFSGWGHILFRKDGKGPAQGIQNSPQIYHAPSTLCPKKASCCHMAIGSFERGWESNCGTLARYLRQRPRLLPGFSSRPLMNASRLFFFNRSSALDCLQVGVDE